MAGVEGCVGMLRADLLLLAEAEAVVMTWTSTFGQCALYLNMAQVSWFQILPIRRESTCNRRLESFGSCIECLNSEGKALKQLEAWLCCHCWSTAVPTHNLASDNALAQHGRAAAIA
eukprot:1056714-Rhodomonas_salina.1